jgi:dipeptide/tripeptide permease
MDIYTMSNPIVIVSLQLVITKLFGKMKPIRSMIAGTLIISTAVAMNMLPVLLRMDVRASLAGLLPLGGFLMVASFAMCALAELFTSPRMYEYVGALAPKGQEGLFLGYANLPLAIGSLAGGPVGAAIFNEVMARGATRRPDGLLDLVPSSNAAGWLILAAVGLTSAFCLWLLNRWLERSGPQANAT